MKTEKLLLSAVTFCGFLGTCVTAQAFEDTSPIMPGVTIGDPTGAAPPPGLYFQTGFVYFNMKAYNGSGNSLPVTIHDYNSINQLLWVPQLPEIFGANYYMFIAQPIRGNQMNTPAGTFTSVGLENTPISPVNLSWNLHNGFFVAAGFTFYPIDGAYRHGYPVNVSRNYVTYEPSLAVSYLANGWNASIHAAFELNGTNGYEGYHSGDGMVTDFYALHQFGKFELGLGGTWTQQFSNDTIDGVPVAATSSNGLGNKSVQVDLGPVVTYDFGPAKVKAYWLHDVYVANYAGGDRFYLKLELPLIVNAPPAGPVTAKY